MNILDTLNANKGKELRFDIKKDISINSFKTGGYVLYIYQGYGNSASFWFRNKRGIDSLKSCYKKYKEEINLSK